MNRNTQAIITYLFLVPLVYYIPPNINKLTKLPRLLNVSLSVGIIVVLMSYLIMPLFKRVFFNKSKELK